MSKQQPPMPPSTGKPAESSSPSRYGSKSLLKHHGGAAVPNKLPQATTTTTTSIQSSNREYCAATEEEEDMKKRMRREIAGSSDGDSDDVDDDDDYDDSSSNQEERENMTSSDDDDDDIERMLREVDEAASLPGGRIGKQQQGTKSACLSGHLHDVTNLQEDEESNTVRKNGVPSTFLPSQVQQRSSEEAAVDDSIVQSTLITKDYLKRKSGYEDLHLVSHFEAIINTTTSLGIAGAPLIAEEMTGLIELRLSNSAVPRFSDLGPAKFMKHEHLTVLWMNNCGLSELDGIQFCERLEECYLAFNDITASEMSYLSSLGDHLQILDLEGNQIEAVVVTRGVEGRNNDDDFDVLAHLGGDALHTLQTLRSLSTVTMTGNPYAMQMRQECTRLHEKENKKKTEESSSFASFYLTKMHELLPQVDTLDDMDLKVHGDTTSTMSLPTTAEPGKSGEAAVSTTDGTGSVTAHNHYRKKHIDPFASSSAEMLLQMQEEIEMVNSSIKRNVKGNALNTAIEEQHRTLYSRIGTTAARTAASRGAKRCTQSQPIPTNAKQKRIGLDDDEDVVPEEEPELKKKMRHHRTKKKKQKNSDDDDEIHSDYENEGEHNNKGRSGVGYSHPHHDEEEGTPNKKKKRSSLCGGSAPTTLLRGSSSSSLVPTTTTTTAAASSTLTQGNSGVFSGSIIRNLRRREQQQHQAAPSSATTPPSMLSSVSTSGTSSPPPIPQPSTPNTMTVLTATKVRVGENDDDQMEEHFEEEEVLDEHDDDHHDNVSKRSKQHKAHHGDVGEDDNDDEEDDDDEEEDLDDRRYELIDSYEPNPTPLFDKYRQAEQEDAATTKQHCGNTNTVSSSRKELLDEVGSYKTKVATTALMVGVVSSTPPPLLAGERNNAPAVGYEAISLQHHDDDDDLL